MKGRVLLSDIFSSFALGHLNQSVVRTSLWLFYNPDLISEALGNSLWTNGYNTVYERVAQGALTKLPIICCTECAPILE